MKKFLMLAIMGVTMNAYAGSSTSDELETNGIVTPQVATGVYRTKNFDYDESMNIVVCMNDYKYSSYEKKCTDSKGNNKWKRITQVPHSSKKYVGFKSITQDGYQYLEIYWK